MTKIENIIKSLVANDKIKDLNQHQIKLFEIMCENLEFDENYENNLMNLIEQTYVWVQQNYSEEYNSFQYNHNNIEQIMLILNYYVQTNLINKYNLNLQLFVILNFYQKDLKIEDLNVEIYELLRSKHQIHEKCLQPQINEIYQIKSVSNEKNLEKLKPLLKLKIINVILIIFSIVSIIYFFWTTIAFKTKPNMEPTQENLDKINELINTMNTYIIINNCVYVIGFILFLIGLIMFLPVMKKVTNEIKYTALFSFLGPILMFAYEIIASFTNLPNFKYDIYVLIACVVSLRTLNVNIKTLFS